MSSTEVASVAEPGVIHGESAPVTETIKKAEKVAKEKKARLPKEKKPKSPKAPAAHPTYMMMIKEAIGSLKERTGSSQYAIAKYMEDKYKEGLPQNFKRILSVQLRNLTKSGKLTKVKSSFKLSDELKKEPKPAKDSKALRTPRAAKKTAGLGKAFSKPKLAKGVASPKSVRKSTKTTKVKPVKSEVKPVKHSKTVKLPAKVTTSKKPSKRTAPSPRKASAPKTSTPKKATTPKKSMKKSTPKKAPTPKKTVKSAKSTKSPQPPKSPKVKTSTRSAPGPAKKPKK